MAEAAGGDAVAPAPAPVKKARRGIVSSIWKGIFGPRGDDYEKKLQYLSKEEGLVHARMKRRALWSRRTARNVIMLSVAVEVVAVAYAIMTTRSVELNWKMRAVRVMPMFVLPGLFSVIYSTLLGFTRMLDRKDQKTLERLRAERKEKIDELKEKTKYYSTQELIQRYDLDPAAKAAAASVLASKLGADSGLKVYLGDDSKTDAPSGKSSDVEPVQSTGLRNRRQPHGRNNSAISETSTEYGADDQETAHGPKVVEHFRGTGPNNGGFIARIAALLVGEDPSQSYALICGNCHMHNGLARKEDFPYVKYFCPHCHALNQSGLSAEQELIPYSGDASRLSASSVPDNEITASSTTVAELPLAAE